MLHGLALGLLLAGAPARAQDGPAAASTVDAAPQPLEVPPFGDPLSDDREIDRITEAIGKGLRCPVCQGLSVSDSPADGARTMKARIRELVAMGYSQEQIEDYFVDRYGDWVKLEPPARGRHLLVWGLPISFVVFGAGLVSWYIKANLAVRSRRREDDAELAEDDGLEPYRQRILAELAADGEG